MNNSTNQEILISEDILLKRKKAREASNRWRNKPENKEKIKESIRQWNKNNKQRVKAYRNNYQKQNSKQYKIHQKKTYYKNVKKRREWRSNWRKKRLETDEMFAVIEKLRGVVSRAFERIKQNKVVDTQSSLGCSWEEAKVHIESLWNDGMTWKNHGQGPGYWNIDHIKPVASFTKEDMHLMNHISNLQPLWFECNQYKSDKYPFV